MVQNVLIYCTLSFYSMYLFGPLEMVVPGEIGDLAKQTDNYGEISGSVNLQPVTSEYPTSGELLAV